MDGLEAFRERSFDVDAGHVGHEDDALRAEPDRERARGLVGIHVQRPFGDRRDDRDPALAERPLDGRRRNRDRLADEPELRQRAGSQPDLVADELKRRGAECGGKLGPDGDQRLSHDGGGRWTRDAAAVHELGTDPPAGKLGADLRPGAVDDHDLVACLHVLENVDCRHFRDPPADLDDDPAHVVYSAFSFT